MSLTVLESDFRDSVLAKDKNILEACLNKNPMLASRLFVFYGIRSFALHIAIVGNWEAGIEILIKNSEDLNIEDEKGNTALHIAASQGNLFALKKLVEKGVDIFTEDALGRNSLHISCEYGWSDSVNYLINFARDNADAETFDKFVNSKTLRGLTPLHYATNNNHYDIVEVLLSNDTQASVNTVARGKLTPLQYSASHCEQFNLTKKMVLLGADVDAITELEKFTPLYWAAKNNCTETVEYLAKTANADVITIEGETPVYIAAKYGFEQVAKILLQHMANPNLADIKGVYPLHLAAFNNNKLLIKYLLLNGAEIDVADSSGNSPLLLAASLNYDDVTKYLIFGGANASFVNPEDGKGFAHAACIGGDVKILDFIKNLNQSLIYAQDKSLATALHYAAANNQTDAVDFLINLGMGIDLRDQNGFTALQVAALNNNRQVVEKLIAAGANQNMITFIGLNAYELAQQMGAKEVESYLGSIAGTNKATTSSFFTSLYKVAHQLMFSPVCRSPKSENPFLNELSSEVLDGLSKAALETGTNMLQDYCKIYSLNSLGATHTTLLKQDDCAKYGLESITTINNYLGDSINVCGRDNYNRFQLSPEVKILLGNIALYGAQKVLTSGYNFVTNTHAHQRWDGFVKGIWDGLLPGALLELKELPKLLTLYSPKIGWDLLNIGKSLWYNDKTHPMQILVKEIATLHKNSYFYLTELPGKCAQTDHVAYNMTYEENNYNICESANYPISNSFYSYLPLAAFALPAINSIVTGIRADTPVKKAIALGNALVALGAIGTVFLASFFPKTDLSISQYKANEYMHDHKGDKPDMYLVQKPGSCANEDAILHDSILGDWLVCQSVAAL